MSLSVAIYQGGVLSRDGQENLLKIDEILNKARNGNNIPDIIVFPELFLGGYNAAHLSFGLEGEDGPKTKLQEIVKKYKIAVCIGWVEHNSPSPSPSSSSPSPPYKNISLILNKEGEIILSHTKTHLWDVFENDNFVKGEGLPDCVVLCGLKVSTIICYEVEFPEIVREMRNKGAEVLFVPTGVCAPSSSSPINAHISRNMVPCRAMENNLYICYVNRAGQEGEMNFIGHSTIVDPFGTPLAHLSHLPELSEVFELKSDEVQKAITTNPYRRDYRPEIFQKE